MSPLTKRRSEVLEFIRAYSKQNGYAPSLHEIRKGLNIASVSTAHFHVQRLKNSGYLEGQRGQPRAMDIPRREKLLNIPLLGTIAAGSPIEALLERETIAIPQDKVGSTENVYALRVAGDSMIDEGINDGDIVLVRHQSTARNGQKVVALLDNDRVTLKKFYQEKGAVRLQPANQRMGPMVVRTGEDIAIQGIVLDVIRGSPADASDNELMHPNLRSHLAGEAPRHEITLSARPQKKPKGGCELMYEGKLSEEEILANVKPAQLRLVEKYGEGGFSSLIRGDNLSVLRNLCEDQKIIGAVDLIYIDPPFGTGQDFVGYQEGTGYSDRLVNTEFLEFLRHRLVFLRELLSPRGSIYLHIDQKIGHYVKLVMDEVFGDYNFRNDITRIKCNPKNFERKAYGNIKDVIYFYSRSPVKAADPLLWNDFRPALSDSEVEKQFPRIDAAGRRYATTPLHAKGETQNGPTGRPWKGLMPPKGRHWRYAPTELSRLDDAGLIEWSATGNPRKIIFAAENKGKKIQDVWDFRDPGYERSLYPTEKNEDLLRQIILASSEKDSIVLDCFSGSGTTLAAAAKLGRKWIGIDSSESAIEVAKRRLGEIGNNFSVYEAA